MSELVRIPAGPFARGSPEGVGLPNEQPQRSIVLSAFEIQKLPVTWREFAAFLDSGGYSRREGWSDAGWALAQQEAWTRPRFWSEAGWEHTTGPEQPVIGVSFFEAEAYAAWLGLRLPTEAEWEKAARGTDGRLYAWGDEWAEDLCSFRGGSVRAAPVVGMFPLGASPYGLLDVCGGVWEWCSDWYDDGYYRRAPGIDPLGPENGTMKVGRGGAWNALPLLNRTANRNAWRPTARFSNIGFRCARSS